MNCLFLSPSPSQIVGQVFSADGRAHFSQAVSLDVFSQSHLPRQPSQRSHSKLRPQLHRNASELNTPNAAPSSKQKSTLFFAKRESSFLGRRPFSRGVQFRFPKVDLVATITSAASSRQDQSTDMEIVSVPMDLYRVLFVSPDASKSMLDKAMQERLPQVPSRGFSSRALKARQELLEQAYSILTSKEKRTAYTAALRASPQNKPFLIQLPLSHIQGALILLHECGQHADVVKFGRELLVEEYNEAEQDSFPDNYTPDPDIVLAVARSLQSLSMEQLRERRYDQAGTLLNDAVMLLDDYHYHRTDLMLPQFRSLEDELQAELACIRPDRIRELVQPDPNPDNVEARRVGLQLLREMIQARGGVEGSGNDGSGLNSVQFREFVAQVRPYLFVQEQEAVFASEDGRISFEAMMMAVQAAIAQGFVNKQPLLIQEAQRRLRLIDRERPCPLDLAMVCMLLGQPNDASSYLDAIQRHDADAFNYIRRQSEGSPDLIQGLMKCVERWLLRDILRVFRDYASYKVSVQAYFTDPMIESELSALKPLAPPALSESPIQLIVGQKSRRERDRAGHVISDLPKPSAVSLHSDQSGGRLPFTFHLDEPAPGTPLQGHLDPPTGTGNRPQAAKRREARQPPSLTPPRPAQPAGPSTAKSGPLPRVPVGRRWEGADGTASGTRTARSAAKGFQVKVPNWNRAALIAAGVVGAGVVLLGPVRSLVQRSEPDEALDGDEVDGEENLDEVDQVASPTEDKELKDSVDKERNVEKEGEKDKVKEKEKEKDEKKEKDLGSTKAKEKEGKEAAGAGLEATAKSVISSWQSVKADALGSTYSSTRLAEVLAEPALSGWKSRAQNAKTASWHWVYKLNSLNVDRVEVDPVNPNRCVAEATISETAQLFERGALNKAQSYDKAYRAQYTLIKSGAAWKISDMRVIR